MKLTFYRDDGTVLFEQKLRSATVDTIKHGIAGALDGENYDDAGD